jgi:hypothetical protein
MNLDKLMTVGVLGLAAYLVYKVSQGFAKVPTPGEALTSAQSGVTSLLETFFPQGNAQLDPNATIVLSTGEEIPASTPKGVGQFTDTDNTQKFQFFYAGRTWRTTSAQPDDTRTYYAFPLGG